MDIRHTSLHHGWFYHYRMHCSKSCTLCGNGMSSLSQFMERMLSDCPDHYFEKGPRSSALRFDVSTYLVRADGHEICRLAELGLKHGRYKTAHSNVEVYMLENDAHTVAVELPIWLHPHELDTYRALFDCEDPLTGHIDILRVEDGKIWIWDYKPNAEKEKYADCQVLFYAIMLSNRTGIPLENFRCGYFDEKTAFMFKPETTQLPICASATVKERN
ncbi:PD-(D/E)XK nuclease family protein [Candidatus Woesearchaeota archaeon]|nr:PD-(D/E)XK nuclease family protein [Candidatus Woesearchaeota archaeon]